jgi:hypothetical protein
MRREEYGRRGLGGFVRCALALCLGTSCALVDTAAAAPPAAVLLAAGTVGQAGYGTIKGRLVWGGDKPPDVRILAEKGKAQKDPDICAKDQTILSHELEVDPTSKGVAYGFAYLVRPQGTNPDAVRNLVASSPKVEFDQKNCDFLPHSLAMHQDQMLVLRSSDPKMHNVRVTGFNNGINKTIGPQQQIEEKLAKETRPIYVKCDIHPWMSANLLVLDHPFFAVTGRDGSFEIKGVPAGDQNLMVWQEKVGYVTSGGSKGQPVKVQPGEVLDVGEIKLDPAKVK